MTEERVIPRHVAIILDGNGRYAKEHGIPRRLGHKAGCDNLEVLVQDAADLGIEILTVYGFSTENWKRSDEEVGALMTLFRIYLRRLKKVATAKNVKVRSIGVTSRFSEDIREALRDLEDATKDNTRMEFVIAINYGGRDELTRVARDLARKAVEGLIRPEDITEQTINDALDTAGLPDPDLLIRTGGELRLSNYLLWQSAYTEFYYTDTLWPDFHKEQLEAAIEEYSHRNRRYGGR